VRVGAGALQEPVLPREAERFVVERLPEQAGVEDLEHVDLGDRLLEIALVDLVGGHSGRHEELLNLPR